MFQMKQLTRIAVNVEQIGQWQWFFHLIIIFTSLNVTWIQKKKNFCRRLFSIEIEHSLVHPYIALRTRIPRAVNTTLIIQRI